MNFLSFIVVMVYFCFLLLITLGKSKKNITFGDRFVKKFSMPLKTHTPFNEYVRQNSGHHYSLQDPKVVWMTGLSGAGKTTLALALEKKIREKGFFAIVLDGDIMRDGINKDLGYSASGRTENIRRTAEIAKLFADQGLIVICSFITPQKSMRDMARSIIGESRFIELFVNCPIEICEQRDIKGLYEKARTGLIKEFTGITAPYDIPENPDFEIHTDLLDIDVSVEHITSYFLPLINCQNPE
jgi:adenylylsulfate kinase